MRRRLAYVLVWAVATAVTAGGSWLGIRSMLGAAAPQRTGPLSAADLRAAAPATIGPATALPSPTPSASPSPSPSPSVSPSPSRSKSPAPAPSDARTTPPAAPEGPAQGGSWTDTGGGAFERTFTVRGGTATIRLTEGGITVVSAAPKGGFTLDQDSAPSSARVTFESDTHTSSIWVTWRRGGPYAEITETV